MGLFNRIGRGVEQFAQTAKTVAQESADYQCRACGAQFHVDHDECPECGEQAVVSTTSEA